MNTYSDNNDDLDVPTNSTKKLLESGTDNMISDDTSYKLAGVFKVLGDPSRVKIIYALLQSELCVGDISSTVGISQSAVSHQLRGLRDLRLVKSRRDGQLIHYSLDDLHVINLLSECLEHIQEG